MTKEEISRFQSELGKKGVEARRKKYGKNFMAAAHAALRARFEARNKKLSTDAQGRPC